MAEQLSVWWVACTRVVTHCSTVGQQATATILTGMVDQPGFCHGAVCEITHERQKVLVMATRPK